MREILLSVLLGVIEGLTEFLPVSSTAHLRISEYLFKIKLDDEYWKMYSIVIQLGAILSVVVYFRKRIADFVRTFPRGQRGDRTVLTHPLTLTLIAFVVTAVPAFLLHSRIKHNLESLYIMAGALFVGGVVMWIVDAIFRRPRIEHMEDMGLLHAVWIGAMQIFSAVFPGVSRSMSTIAAGQVVKMSRPAALEFSFFLCIPTMFAATGYELYSSLFPKNALGKRVFSAAPLTGEQWLILAIGFVVSFFVAWAVIAWFMNWVRQRGFAPFAIYRMVLGAVVAIWAYYG